MVSRRVGYIVARNQEITCMHWQCLVDALYSQVTLFQLSSVRLNMAK